MFSPYGGRSKGPDREVGDPDVRPSHTLSYTLVFYLLSPVERNTVSLSKPLCLIFLVPRRNILYNFCVTYTCRIVIHFIFVLSPSRLII